MQMKNFQNSKQRNTIAFNRGRNTEVEVPNNNSGHSRLSWPQFYQRNRNNLSTTNSKTPAEDRHNRDSTGSSAFERVLCPDEARVMQKANQIVMYVPLIIRFILVVEIVFHVWVCYIKNWIICAFKIVKLVKLNYHIENSCIKSKQKVIRKTVPLCRLTN